MQLIRSYRFNLSQGFILIAGTYTNLKISLKHFRRVDVLSIFRASGGCFSISSRILRQFIRLSKSHWEKLKDILLLMGCIRQCRSKQFFLLNLLPDQMYHGACYLQPDVLCLWTDEFGLALCFRLVLLLYCTAFAFGNNKENPMVVCKFVQCYFVVRSIRTLCNDYI